MLVWAQRTVSVLTTRALVYGGLFVFVVVLHLALSAALREHGWNSGLALTASGGAVLGLVLVLFNLLERVREWRSGRREMERVRQRLPGDRCAWCGARRKPRSPKTMNRCPGK
ncbi:MAG: hypothetical protein M0D54_18375 [Hyphomonadaceae bacterium JAD_PAG50586_4]|nr:MAG: hypothetical protein M0D54_18375 [Hyphomonadaceae bacterium JAD_PAG50586_4]